MKTENLPGDATLPSSGNEIIELINRGERGGHLYSVEDFFRNPDQSAYQLSPDGTYFSFLAPYKRRRNVFVQKIGESRATRLTDETERDIPGYGWANNNRLIYVKDSGGDENFQLFAIDKNGENPMDLTPFEGVRIQIIDILEDMDEEIIIGMNKNNPQLFEPYRLNVITGDLTQLAENKDVIEPIAGWMTDHDGKLRLAFKVRNGTNNVILYRDSESDSFREILTTDFTESLVPLVFDFEQPHIAFSSSNLERDKSVIIRFDFKTGQEIGDPLYSHPDVDVSNLNFSRKRKKLISISYITDKKHRVFLDEETKEIYNFLEKELPGYEVAIASMNRDEDKFIIRTYSDRSLGSYFFYDKTSGSVAKLTDISPWLDENLLSPMKPVSYKSRDGLTINGYLTLPRENHSLKFPVIVNPHGGPWVRNSWGYNPEVQLFASRGYAVFQMNYRGSTGYGKEFWKSSFKQWGKKMQDDITDGVNWLIKKGIADPGKIAIYGGSYGGYATLAGITFTQDLYCCAIDYVGVSNLFTFMKTIPPYWKPYLDMMYEMVGHPEKDKEQMESASPVFHVDKITTPLFIVQGANDPRVNIDESDQMVRSLRSRGIDVPYMVRYNEGHGFQNEENRFEFYKAALGFLSRYLG